MNTSFYLNFKIRIHLITHLINLIISIMTKAMGSYELFSFPSGEVERVRASFLMSFFVIFFYFCGLDSTFIDILVCVHVLHYCALEISLTKWCTCLLWRKFISLPHCLKITSCIEWRLSYIKFPVTLILSCFSTSFRWAFAMSIK